MFFYKVEADIVNAKKFQAVENSTEPESMASRRNVKDGYKSFRYSDVWDSFKEFAGQNSEEYFQKSGKETYVFCAGIKNETRIIIGILSRVAVDAYKLADEYLKQIDAKFINLTSNEITMKSVRSLLQTSDRNGLISDDEEVLELFGLDEIIGRYDPCIDFYETIIDTAMSLKKLLKKTQSLLCNETLIPELERIYELPPGFSLESTGHPVHYMLQTDDADVRNEMLGILLSALLYNGRIHSSRYCTVTIDERRDGRHRGGVDKEKLDCLYMSCRGGAVVMDIKCDNETNGGYAVSGGSSIEKISTVMRKYKNDVLTVFCMPRSCDKVRNLLMENLGAVSLVSISEDIVFGETAKKYLKQLAKKNKVATDKSLFKTVSDTGKGHLSADLNLAFDEWYAKKLKTKVFPQYASFESASCAAIRKKAKGSAYENLENLIGLSEAKGVINQALDFYKAQKLFKEKGISTDKPSMHMVFTGNPGSAKTTVARLFAQIMKDNGLLSVGNLHEVGRADLVGMFVGWTAQIVKKKFREAKGSVLFIDEAYSLVDDKDGLYGDEAINTIVQEMENLRDDMVVIFAGYPEKMEKFLQKNPGLRSRIAFHVPFADYNEDELYQITELMAKDKEITLGADVRDKLLPIYKAAMQSDDFGNGRFARNMIEKAVMKQASRLVSMNPEDVTKDDVTTLLAEDFEAPAETKPKVMKIGFVA